MKPLLTFLMLLLVAPCLAHSVVREGNEYKVTHEWTYEEREWSFTFRIPVELYRYYQGRAHQTDDPVQYVLSDYDRDCIRSLAASFREAGTKAGYDKLDNIGNVASFVQSLRYKSDKSTTGEDNYVRFPVETLVDGVGDCEDLAILAAAILHEMGYGVLLVEYPDHLALAVDCEGACSGTYYKYNGNEYHYLEVTHTGWTLGKLPEEFQKSKFRLLPLVYRPKIHMSQCGIRQSAYYSTDSEVPFTIDCNLENKGPGSTEGLSFHVTFIKSNGTTVASRTFTFDELREGESDTYTLTIGVPRPLRGTLELHVEGANFDTESVQFEDIELH